MASAGSTTARLDVEQFREMLGIDLRLRGAAADIEQFLNHLGPVYLCESCNRPWRQIKIEVMLQPSQAQLDIVALIVRVDRTAEVLLGQISNLRVNRPWIDA